MFIIIIPRAGDILSWENTCTAFIGTQEQSPAPYKPGTVVAGTWDPRTHGGKGRIRSSVTSSYAVSARLVTSKSVKRAVCISLEGREGKRGKERGKGSQEGRALL